VPSSLLYICCPPAERRQTELLLKAVGFSARWADSAPEALAALEERQSVVLADYADARTAPIVGDIRRLHPATFMLAVSDVTRKQALEEVQAAGLPIVLHRPLQPQTLALLITGATLRSPDAWLETTNRFFRPIFTESEGMRAALAAAKLAATRGGGVLLCGEDGSGRGMLAREIHDCAGDPDRPFVRVDCAEGGSEELEARLFGAAGPVADERHGHSERISYGSALHGAQGGTLFLEHLPEASDRVQARLARVLRDGEALQGEWPRPTPLAIRPVASSDPGWEDAIEEGRVRADLAKRIAVNRVDVPPLRERRRDIPPLAACFLHRVCVQHQVPLRTIDDAALALMTALPWRGNARELSTFLEAVVARTPGPAIRVEDVLTMMQLDVSPRHHVPSGTLREARTRFERDYIASVLQKHRGRVGEAARALGIQRTNLYRKMRELNVNWHGANGSARGGHDPGS
jgi:DNA-binding NtrC family response regulator